jgi:hypothetical protein
VLDQMTKEGSEINVGALRKMSPYLTKHINRFSTYQLACFIQCAPTAQITSG